MVNKKKPSVLAQRLEPDYAGSVVLFLVGFRINAWWKPHKWIKAITSFNRILKELDDNPQFGCLGYEKWIGINYFSLQYWRSHEALLEYARSKQAVHFASWVKFNEYIGKKGDIGLWHEIYALTPGNYEGVYKNMPLFGLGKATKVTSAKGPRILPHKNNVNQNQT